MRTLARITVLVASAVLAGSALAAPVAAEDPKASATPTTSQKTKSHTASGEATILSLPVGADIGDLNAGPLTRIVVGQDLSCAVNHRDDGTVGEFYGDRACGTFLALNGTLYGPPNIPAGGNASPLTAWTPVSQTTSGDGSGGNPKRVVTEVVAGTTNVHVIETDTYTFGQEFYSTLVRVENRGTSFADFIVYRAADCFLGNDDNGFGHTDINGIGETVQCVAAKVQQDGTRVPGDRRIEWYPLSRFSHYMEAFYSDIWARIGQQQEFPNTILPSTTYTDNGAGLSWRGGLPAAGSVEYAHLLTISPDFAAQRVCEFEDLSFTKTSGRVTVHYDPRYLWSEKDQNYLTKAAWVAQAVADRADTTLTKYAGLGFGIPAVVNANLKCDPEQFGIHRDANVDAPGVMNLRDGWLKTDLTDFVDKKVLGQTPTIDHTDVQDVIDHELLHVVQVEQNGVPATIVDVILSGDSALTEGTAVLGQDLVSDIDDDQPSSSRTRSFLGIIADFINDPRAVDYYGIPDPRRPYSVAGFYEYLAEQKAGATNHLEQHAASFISATIEEGNHFSSLAHAMGASSTDAVLDALRDFYATLYARNRANAASLPTRFRILDEITAFDQQAGTGSGLPSWGTMPSKANTLVAGVPLILDETAFGGLEPTDGGLFEVSLPAGATELRITVQDHPDLQIDPRRYTFERIRLGFMPLNGSNQATIDPGMFRIGPPILGTDVTDIPVVGMTKLGIAVVNGHQVGDFKITVETRAGTPAITMDPVSSVAQDEVGGGVQAFVHPSVGGIVSRGLPTRSYTAKIDGVTVTVGSTYDLGSTQMLLVKPNGSLAQGAHTLQISYGSASASRSFNVDAPGGGQSPIPAGGRTSVGQVGLLSATGQVSGTTGTLFTVLNVGGSAKAGEPIDISFVLADQAVGLPGASVVATLTDPIGGTRQVPLRDQGSQLDGGSADGFYGVQAYGTDRSGTWTIRVDATGTSPTGVPFTLSATTTVALAAKVDVDGDGVADGIEASFGLSPSNPADGAYDADADGATIAQELSAGSNPNDPDTDNGGESDGSEIATGRSVLLPSDDRTVVDPALAVRPLDGRTMRVSVAASDISSPVHLYRVDSATGTISDLGVRPGSLQTIVDGPLAAGFYEYRAVVEMASGAKSPPLVFGPVEARDDATVPTARILLNDNRPATNSTHLGVLFVDVSETLADMRLASSEAGLATAAWQPFAPLTAFDVATGDGAKTVYAQVRDPSGLVSWPISNAIVLDTVAPSSAAGAIPAVTTAASVNVPFTATDARSSIDIVELWSRFRATSTGTWSSWAQVAFSAVSPIAYTFPSDGFYEFSTVAVDSAGNQEATPTVADTSTKVDRVAPTSAAGVLPATVSSSTVAVPYTASDAVSGVATVELWSRYRATSTGTWSAWTLGPSGTVSPITYAFSNGDGFYELYTIAIDVAGNRELAPASADATTQKVSGVTGTGKAWGSNTQGQLGNGTTNGSALPVDVSNLTGITSLGAGAEHSLAVKSDGTAWAWGQNANGELGDGTTTDRTTPVQVSGLSGVSAVAGGAAHSLALKSAGTVWAFGLNQNGQLGDGSTTQRTTPVQVSGLTGVIAIATGSDHSLALKSDGTVWAWGKNTNGQLGDGTKTKRTTPVRAGTLTGIVAIAAGGDHSLAVKSDGTVWAWGYNFYGELGDGSTTNRTSPVQATGLTGVVRIAAGANHSLAVKSDGTVWAWGNNGLGQLGDGTTTTRKTAVRSGTLTGVTRLAAGAHHSLALKSDGTLWAWGYNLYGQVGDGTTTNRTSAVQVTGLSGIAAIAGGAFFSLAATGGT